MRFDDFEILYHRCSSGEASLEEQKQFEEFKDGFNLSDTPWTSEMGHYETIRAKLSRNLNKQIASGNTYINLRWFGPLAASVFLALTISFFIGNSFRTNKKIQQASNHIPKSKILPGRNQAVLIMSNGTQIKLDDSQANLVFVESKTRVSKDKHNRLVYNQSNIETTNANVIFNTLVTPRGGQYELMLSDGTKVWLNADSKLKYPISFVGKERAVELVGEAYFEVAQNQGKPFKVLSGEKTIEVLGTHFNVNAYKNEPYETTLLEGGIRLSVGNNPAKQLKPGQQATLGTNQRIRIANVNVLDAIAWKNGIFVFDNENIESVMRKISRWYDVEVTFHGDVLHKRLGGTVSRYSEIDQLLKTIELTESIHFKIDGRRVKVML